MNMRISAVLILAGLVLGAAILGCGSNGPIKIGFLAGTSGKVADIGTSGRDAVQMAVEECNRKGGIRGRRVHLVIMDDKHDPETARKAVREMEEQGVAAIIGPMTSAMAVAVAPLLDKYKTVAVSPTVTTRQLSGIDDYFYRVCATTREYAAKSANYQISHGGARRIAAAYDLGNRSFTESWLNNFKEAFTKNGGEIVAEKGFKSDDGSTFTEIVESLLSADPDCILILANSVDSALLCQQIRKMNRQIHITVADWGATERLLELGGKAVEGVTVVQTFNRQSKNPGYLAFKKAFQERYNKEPGFPGTFAYDAAQVVLEALRLGGNGKSLKDVLKSQGRFDGLQGIISFDEYGDAKTSNAAISIVLDHKFVIAE